jgi:hypothetical protein
MKAVVRPLPKNIPVYDTAEGRQADVNRSSVCGKNYTYYPAFVPCNPAENDKVLRLL